MVKLMASGVIISATITSSRVVGEGVAYTAAGSNLMEKALRKLFVSRSRSKKIPADGITRDATPQFLIPFKRWVFPVCAEVQEV